MTGTQPLKRNSKFASKFTSFILQIVYNVAIFFFHLSWTKLPHEICVDQISDAFAVRSFDSFLIVLIINIIILTHDIIKILKNNKRYI